MLTYSVSHIVNFLPLNNFRLTYGNLLIATFYSDEIIVFTEMDDGLILTAVSKRYLLYCVYL